MRHLILTILLGFSSWALAQRVAFEPDTLSALNPWTDQEFAQPDDSFQFAVIGDLTGGYRSGVFPVAVDKANAVSPDFVISVGDLIEGYTKDTAQIQRWWNQFDKWVGKLAMPFFYVPGNHDLSNALMTRLWEERYGRTYYHFIYRNILFLVLNTEDGAPLRISAEQADYFESVLSQHSDVDWTLLFFHKPLWQEGEPGFSRIETALKDRSYTVFAGHTHRYLKQQRKGRDYYILGTTGGGSELKGAEFGQLDHFAWVTMRKEGPQVTNLTLEGILHDSLVTDETAPLVDCVLKSSTIKYDAIVETQASQEWSTNLRFRNYCGQPLRIKGRLFSHSQIEPDWVRIDTIIEAYGFLEKALHLSTDQILWGSKLEPIELDWSVETLEGDFRQSFVESITIANANYCEKPPSDLVIDGRWEEWGRAVYQAPAKLEYYRSAWQSIEDCGLSVRVAANENNLFLALKVQDDNVFYTPYRHSWEQEGALLEIKLPNQLSIRLGFSPMDSLLVDVNDNWPREGELKATRSKNGFAAELSLPISHLEQLNAAPLDQFQLQWTVYDHDHLEDQYKGTKALWQNPFPGSGTFFLQKTKH